MTKVFGTLAILCISAVIVLTSTLPVLTKEVTTWTETTGYPLEIANRNAVVHDGYLYNVGGRLEPENSAQAFVASAKINEDGSLGAWISQTPLPVPIYLHAVVATDQHLYAIGGWDNVNRLATVYRAAFQPNGGLGNWFPISSLAEAVTLHQAVLVGNQIFVLGGYTNNLDTPATAAVYRATISNAGVSAWTKTTDLPQALYRHGAAATDTTIYVTGGFTGSPQSGTSSSAVYYASVNPNGTIGAWRTGPALPQARHYHQSVNHDGRLFVIGGTTDTTTLNSVLSAEIREDGSLGAWRQEPALPEPLLRFAAVSVRLFESDLIYIIGGINGNGIYRDNVYHSDVPPKPTPTPTPTATPSFLLQLEQSPTDWVAPGEKVTYQIAFAGNQADPLTDLSIIGTVPDNVELVPDSITSASGGSVSVSGTQPGSSIVWTWPSLPADGAGSVSYQVVRPISPTPPVPLALSIDKSGPDIATASQEIQYTLTITNNAPLTVTNLRVRDSVPSGATYVRGGTLSDGIVTWAIETLLPFSSTSVDYVVTAESTLINSDYDVSADGGIQVRGRRTIVTVVDGTAPAAGGDGLVVVNPGATARWTSAVGPLELSSNAVRNPEFGIYLPLVQR